VRCLVTHAIVIQTQLFRRLTVVYPVLLRPMNCLIFRIQPLDESMLMVTQGVQLLSSRAAVRARQTRSFVYRVRVQHQSAAAT
jgi:hypothetical protein